MIDLLLRHRIVLSPVNKGLPETRRRSAGRAWLRPGACLVATGLMLGCAGAAVPEFETLPRAQMRFAGLAGERVDANVQNWLLRAPQANPGLLEMFRVRDRQPEPRLVKWAGEFAGKYLLSAIPVLEMTDDPRLSGQVSNVVAGLIATQAPDGYLGPFPRQDRLLKNWDLWGHYHAIAALLLWHERTGDQPALAAARKAADLVCATYLNTGRRVLDAGDPEMNMSILTGLAMLYRETGDDRYLKMAREVEKDWESAGDYLRAGLDGREFFQGPRPRWESLHDLQGLFELWRITGEPQYRAAFMHHWRSIRRWDRRNSGAFSSGEQATGNAYAPTAIETCCTVAWIALTVDYLKLTGEPQAADELELSTLNGGLGAQHPSGSWWTYSTPMDGAREASAQAIVFQARAGTPELNCCSANGPRVLAALRDWALMSGPGGLVLNSYLPGTFQVACDGQEIGLEQERDYPRSASQRVLITKSGKREWTLRLRIPAWSANTRVQANFKGGPTQAVAGSYLEVRRRWKAGDAITLEFDFSLRTVSGASEAMGKISLYCGPVLLAWDQAEGTLDEDQVPAVDLARLREARIVSPGRPWTALERGPWLVVEVPVEGGKTLRLVDFASAGASGTRYRSWLPAVEPPPPPALTQRPRDGERIRAGAVQFRWRCPQRGGGLSYRVEVATDPRFANIVCATNSPPGGRVVLNVPVPQAGAQRWWRVVTIGAKGETVPDVPPATFTLAADAPASVISPEPKPGPSGELVRDSLRSGEPLKYGEALSVKFSERSAEGTRLNGREQMLVYSVPEWPEGDVSVAVRVRVEAVPARGVGQIFSAWCAHRDDPLRLSLANGKLHARMEAGDIFATPGTTLPTGRWCHVAAVKQGKTLTLYLDGEPAGSCAVPAAAKTAAQDCAVGGNPHFSGREGLAATLADFGLWERALSAEEVRGLAAPR